MPLKLTTIGPSAKRISMAFCWRVNGPPLNDGLVAFLFLIAKKPYIFVIFQGGPDPLPPLWICP